MGVTGGETLAGKWDICSALHRWHRTYEKPQKSGGKKGYMEKTGSCPASGMFGWSPCTDGYFLKDEKGVAGRVRRRENHALSRQYELLAPGHAESLAARRLQALNIHPGGLRFGGEPEARDLTMAASCWAEMLLVYAALFLVLLGGARACGLVTVNSPSTLLGSTVTASCTIQSNNCSGLKGEAIQIMWRLDNQPMPGSQYQSVNGTEISNLTVSQFNRTRAKLRCYVAWNGTPQLVGMAEVHAGYPPSKPDNLTCMMNLSDNSLTCRWDPGLDSHLPARVALKSSKSRGQCEVSQEMNKDCIPPAGQNSCTLGRSSLQLYQKMDIWVSVQNALGTAESEHLCIDPTDVAKLDPPVLKSIRSVPFQTDCVSVAWETVSTSSHIEQQCELRYRTPEDTEWTLVPNIVSPNLKTQLCGFLFGTDHHVQMRCRRVTALGYWSEWSPEWNFTTHEKAPSGKLDVWWKMTPVDSGKGAEVQLLWKAPRQNEANGRILGYWVSLNPRRRTGELAAICNTTEMQCHFSVPPGVRRVYLSAYNSAGESPATEVIFLEKKGQPLARIHVSPCDEHSLWVQWEAPGAAAMGYILEWYQPALPGPASHSMSWQLERNRSATKALLQGNIEPFQQYNISVYPLYADMVGLPRHAAAYSKEKAPTCAPTLHLTRVSKSHAELCWDPIPIEMQNGFITNYTIFWTSPTREELCAVVNSSFTTFTLRGLVPSTMYKVHIMASTAAGSTNSTTLTLVTSALDETELQYLLLSFGLLCALLITLIVCFQKNRRVKNQFWPSVPDPANSSLSKWVPADLQQETLQTAGVREPGLVTISDVMVLEKGAEKKAPLWGKTDPLPAVAGSFPALPTSYIQASSSSPSSSHSSPGEARPGSYVNGGGAVQYATVVTDGYRGQHQQLPSPLYLWSDSTQPLLSEPTPSPKPYENLWFHRAPQAGLGCPSTQEDGVFLEEPLIDFPLLQGLKIDGAEDLHNFRGV
ncbi:granulocyte colony-stimulating factor receptor [Carettochelys insculpta]|uniref:granulocyte colony-stimulating factor receptor n=1 Tax=Carettochelys insculpta TaxID=44489 RepID=UPI003EBE5A15